MLYSLRIAFSLENPLVWPNAFNLWEAIVGTGVHVDEEEHVEDSADNTECMRWGKDSIQTIKELPEGVDLEVMMYCNSIMDILYGTLLFCLKIYPCVRKYNLR